jgi:hypothetical protein
LLPASYSVTLPSSLCSSVRASIAIIVQNKS